MHNNNTILNTNSNTQAKSSTTLMHKREQFKNQIRKSYLNELFATKRK